MESIVLFQLTITIILVRHCDSYLSKLQLNDKSTVVTILTKIKMANTGQF